MGIINLGSIYYNKTGQNVKHGHTILGMYCSCISSYILLLSTLRCPFPTSLKIPSILGTPGNLLPFPQGSISSGWQFPNRHLPSPNMEPQFPFPFSPELSLFLADLPLLLDKEPITFDWIFPDIHTYIHMKSVHFFRFVTFHISTYTILTTVTKKYIRWPFPFHLLSMGNSCHNFHWKTTLQSWSSMVYFEPVAYLAFCISPDSKVHGANMGPTWALSAPGGPHVGPMNLAIREASNDDNGFQSPTPFDNTDYHNK